MGLTDAQIERYSRQIILPELGGVGQAKLLAAHVAVCGDDAVARWASLYLAAAGVGRLSGVAVGEIEGIARLNPDCRVDADLRCEADLILDGGGAAVESAIRPAPPTRRVLVRAVGATGKLTVVDCLPCAEASMWSHSEPRTQCAEQGERRHEQAPSAAPVIALAATTEILKLILHVGRPLTGRLLVYDANTQAMREEPIACAHRGALS